MMFKPQHVERLVEQAEMIEFAIRGGAPALLVVSALDTLQDEIAGLLSQTEFEYGEEHPPLSGCN